MLHLIRVGPSALTLFAALRPGGHHRLHDTLRGRHRGLHLLRAGCAGRRDRGALRPAAQRPAAGRHLPHHRDQPARVAGRDGSATAAAGRGLLSFMNEIGHTR